MKYRYMIQYMSKVHIHQNLILQFEFLLLQDLLLMLLNFHLSPKCILNILLLHLIK